jgi:uncharacterized protein (DUF342 family)
VSHKTIKPKRPSKGKTIKLMRRLQKVQEKLEKAKEALSTATEGLISPTSPTQGIVESLEEGQRLGKYLVVKKGPEGTVVLGVPSSPSSPVK